MFPEYRGEKYICIVAIGQNGTEDANCMTQQSHVTVVRVAQVPNFLLSSTMSSPTSCHTDPFDDNYNIPSLYGSNRQNTYPSPSHQFHDHAFLGPSEVRVFLSMLHCINSGSSQLFQFLGHFQALYPQLSPLLLTTS